MKKYCDILGIKLSEEECTETKDLTIDDCRNCEVIKKVNVMPALEGITGHAIKGKRKYTMSEAALKARKEAAIKAGKKRSRKISKENYTPPPKDVPSCVAVITLKQGIKHDADKLRYDLVPPEALEEIVKILTLGAAKYTDRNWEKGINYGRVYGALMRHMQAFWRGEDKDIESGLSHLSHAGCCLFFLLTYERREMVEFDDRPVN